MFPPPLGLPVAARYPCGPLISTPPPVGSPHCETVPPSGRPTCVAPDPGAGAVDEAHVPVPGPAACTGRLMPPKPRMPSPPTVAVVTSSRSFKVPSIVVVVDTASRAEIGHSSPFTNSTRIEKIPSLVREGRSCRGAIRSPSCDLGAHPGGQVGCVDLRPVEADWGAVDEDVAHARGLLGRQALGVGGEVADPAG